MTQTQHVMGDLVAEGDALDHLVAHLDGSQWQLPTPAPGWTIAHQIAHLSAVFKMAGMAAATPDLFRAMASQLSEDFDENVRIGLSEFLAGPPEVLLARWRAERAAAERALAVVPPAQLVPWLVRPLPAPVLAAAGMMELFGHGQDVADALGVARQPTDRLRHVVGFAVMTWDFGYLARGLTPPEVQFRFEITAPTTGEVWQFGPADAAQKIAGPAVDFCLLVTRRRHRDDLDVRASGPDADRWLNIAQAYRGPAGAGRAPGQFAAGSR